MNNDNSIIVFKHVAKDMNYIIPEPLENTTKMCNTKIKNAYNNKAFIDEAGIVWIGQSSLHEVLRTNKANAQYIVSNNISDEAKSYYNGEIFVRGYEVKLLLDKGIQQESTNKRKTYLKYSENMYNAVRDCAEAENIRNIYQSLLSDSRKNLKSKRIRKHKIVYDELTGNKLNKKTAEFSHIRSLSLFKNIGDNIENGLVVNKETHEIITKKCISDEFELIQLCNEIGWSTAWYEKFKTCLK